MAEHFISTTCESNYQFGTNPVARLNRCHDLVASNHLLHLWCPWGLRALVSPALQCDEVAYMFLPWLFMLIATLYLTHFTSCLFKFVLQD